MLEDLVWLITGLAMVALLSLAAVKMFFSERKYHSEKLTEQQDRKSFNANKWRK